MYRHWCIKHFSGARALSHDTLISALGEWLIDQALGRPDIEDMFQQVCRRLHAAGVPLLRARLTWPTLHPLFQAETILWVRGVGTEFEQFVHQDEVSDQWLVSPMAYMLDNHVAELRRNLDGPNMLLDFPILDEIKAEGCTDYLVLATPFESTNDHRLVEGNKGIFVNWASDRPGGFSDGDLAALRKIQRRFAAACKAAVQTRIASNITECYLGRHAGRQVLDGAIKLGDGQEVRAVIWYADMRNSTALADTMESSALIELLNDYFDTIAGPVIEYGGEVLDFIGDAVLAIFPYETDEDRARAVRMATMALEDAERLAAERNADRQKAGKVPFDYGIGLTSGTVMFGNIGVAARLAFTVIGPVINQAERIEQLTKTGDMKTLVSAEIAAIEPERWRSIGKRTLTGVSTPCELFAPVTSGAKPDINLQGDVDTKPTLLVQ